MASKTDTSLIDALIEQGLVKRDRLNQVVEESQKTGEPVGILLIKNNLVPEDEMLQLLSENFKIPLVHLKNVSIEKTVIDRIPLKFASYYKFMPIALEGKTLKIAISYPLNVKTQDDIRTQLGYEISEVLARESDIIEVLKVYYGLAADTIQKIMLKSPKEKAPTAAAVMEKIEDIEKLAEDASVVKLVNQIILEGYRKRATDIHIEPFRGKIRLRYRIDGILYDAHAPEDIKHLL